MTKLVLNQVSHVIDNLTCDHAELVVEGILADRRTGDVPQEAPTLVVFGKQYISSRFQVPIVTSELKHTIVGLIVDIKQPLLVGLSGVHPSDPLITSSLV